MCSYMILHDFTYVKQTIKVAQATLYDVHVNNRIGLVEQIP
jgi:hypothetical protein